MRATIRVSSFAGRNIGPPARNGLLVLTLHSGLFGLIVRLSLRVSGLVSLYGVKASLHCFVIGPPVGGIFLELVLGKVGLFAI